SQFVDAGAGFEMVAIFGSLRAAIVFDLKPDRGSAVVNPNGERWRRDFRIGDRNYSRPGGQMQLRRRSVVGHVQRLLLQEIGPECQVHGSGAAACSRVAVHAGDNAGKDGFESVNSGGNLAADDSELPEASAGEEGLLILDIIDIDDCDRGQQSQCKGQDNSKLLEPRGRLHDRYTLSLTGSQVPINYKLAAK